LTASLLLRERKCVSRTRLSDTIEAKEPEPNAVARYGHNGQQPKKDPSNVNFARALCPQRERIEKIKLKYRCSRTRTSAFLIVARLVA